jgi:hypothetical protein
MTVRRSDPARVLALAAVLIVAGASQVDGDGKGDVYGKSVG